MYASERLEFTRGLSTPEEPDLWRKSLTGEIQLWIDLGLPDERRIRKSCNRADQVVVVSYGGRPVDAWREQLGDNLNRFKNLTVINVSADDTQSLQSLIARTMQLQCSIDGGHIWISSDDVSVEVNPVTWKH